MGKILLLNGSPVQKGCVYAALEEMQAEFAKLGVQSEIVQVGSASPAGCRACGYCSKHGRCVIDDLVNKVGSGLDETDGIVCGSPVYYSGASGQLCSFLDRLFYAYAGKLRLKLGSAVVSCRRGGATSTFQRINQYYLMSDMIVVGSQYWNMTHGKTYQDAKSDAEGMQTMRTLARNMAYVRASIEKAALPLPEKEPHLWTNFIRPDLSV